MTESFPKEVDDTSLEIEWGLLEAALVKAQEKYQNSCDWAADYAREAGPAVGLPVDWLRRALDLAAEAHHDLGPTTHYWSTWYAGFVRGVYLKGPIPG